jgi:hypothetical protein
VRPNTRSSRSSSHASRVAAADGAVDQRGADTVEHSVGHQPLFEDDPVVELARGQEFQQVEEIVVAQVERRRRQEDERVGPVGQQRAEGVTPGAAVAEDVRLVDDDQVEPGRELGQPFETAPHPEPLDADHTVEAVREAILLELVEHVVEGGAVELHEVVAEALLHLAPPLADEHRRAHDQDTVGLPTGVELGPHQTRLDRLAETDLVGDQQAHAAGGEQPEDRAELVRPEDRARRPEGVDGVGQVLAELGAGDRRRQPAGRVGGTGDPLERVVVDFGSGERPLTELLGAAVETDVVEPLAVVVVAPTDVALLAVRQHQHRRVHGEGRRRHGRRLVPPRIEPPVGPDEGVIVGRRPVGVLRHAGEGALGDDHHRVTVLLLERVHAGGKGDAGLVEQLDLGSDLDTVGDPRADDEDPVGATRRRRRQRQDDREVAEFVVGRR